MGALKYKNEMVFQILVQGTYKVKTIGHESVSYTFSASPVCTMFEACVSHNTRK